MLHLETDPPAAEVLCSLDYRDTWSGWLRRQGPTRASRQPAKDAGAEIFVRWSDGEVGRLRIEESGS